MGIGICRFFQNDLPLLLEETPLRTRLCMWYQRNRTPPHRSTKVRNHLNRTDPRSWAGWGGHIHGPTGSPDLTPPDLSFAAI
jgi:hypothetical protein